MVSSLLGYSHFVQILQFMYRHCISFLEYVFFHFNTVVFISEMNSSLLGCCVLGHLPNIIIKCECNGFLFFLHQVHRMITPSKGSVSVYYNVIC